MWDGERVGMFLWESSLTQRLPCVDKERCVGWGEGGDVSVGEQFNTAFAMCRQGESMWDGERVGMFLWESSLTQRLPCVDKERVCGMGRGWGCFCGRAV